MTEVQKVRVPVEGIFVRNGRGPLGQSVARHPIGPEFVGKRTTRLLELTPEEAERLTHCTLCGRATVHPGFHKTGSGGTVPHCEVCASYTDEEGRLVGWYGQPREVVS